MAKKKDNVKELKAQITANSKDPQRIKKLLNSLAAEIRRECHEPVEISVPVKEVKKSIDFGACKVSRCLRGYLLEAKGGMYTFVEHRMSRVCSMLNTLFQLNAEKDNDEESREMYDAFSTAVLYVFQSLIFSSLDERSLFDNATAIIHTFNTYASENVEEAEPVDETEQDIHDNVEFENFTTAVQSVIDASGQ